MKLNYVYIDGYKNLNDMEMFFEEESSVNAFIGNNGSGKSNILEALTIIFSKVASGLTSVEFRFHVKYKIDNSNYEISNLEDGIKILKDERNLSKKDLIKAMPKAIFLYYCGETARLKEFSLEYVDKDFEKAIKKEGEVTLKFISYLTVEDFGAALLSNAVFNNDTYSKICTLVNIDGICPPIILKLKRPFWSKRGKADLLWNATGTVAKVLNDFVSMSSSVQKIKPINSDSVEIVIEDIEKLKNDSIGALGLFMRFKMLMQADILHSIEFDVVKGHEKFSYMNLSEGEKQLSQLLSILDITKEYKALFLLDEFDSYLHPNWQRNFVNIIRHIDIRGQVLFTTHSPLTLGKMNKENILLIKDGIAYFPSIETYNRDITEVLEELMEVEKRPPEIGKMIYSFKESVINKNLGEADRVLKELKSVLSKEDPFFITARISMDRLRR